MAYYFYNEEQKKARVAELERLYPMEMEHTRQIRARHRAHRRTWRDPLPLFDPLTKLQQEWLNCNNYHYIIHERVNPDCPCRVNSLYMRFPECKNAKHRMVQFVAVLS
jgi:hypothetical protein